MQRPRSQFSYAVLAAILIALLLYATFRIMGSAVVFDRSGNVVSAVVMASGRETRPLHQLPGHIFYTVPQTDGEIEVRCRDGSRKRWGYVTSHMHTWLRVEPGTGCAKITDVR
jgi:hypothetical protein